MAVWDFFHQQYVYTLICVCVCVTRLSCLVSSQSFIFFCVFSKFPSYGIQRRFKMKRQHGNFPPLHHSPTPKWPPVQGRAMLRSHVDQKKRTPQGSQVTSSRCKTHDFPPKTGPGFFFDFPWGISLSKTKPMDYDSYGCDHFTQDSNFSHPQKKW